MRLKFFPCLKNSANFPANFSSPASIGLGKTSAIVITEKKAYTFPDRKALTELRGFAPIGIMEWFKKK